MNFFLIYVFVQDTTLIANSIGKLTLIAEAVFEKILRRHSESDSGIYSVLFNNQ